MALIMLVITIPCRAQRTSQMRCCCDRYLDALVGLRESPFLPRCKQLTRLRLQAELYALTQVDPTDCIRHIAAVTWIMCGFHQPHASPVHCQALPDI